MKKIILLSLLFAGLNAQSQILKKIGNRVKDNVEWRISHKAANTVDQGLDSLLAIPGKVSDKKKAKKGTEKAPAAKQAGQGIQKDVAGSDHNEKEPEQDDMTPKDGLLTLKLSASEIFTGGSIIISGESVNYKNYKTVAIKVSGPGPADIRNIPLTSTGSYTAEWNANGNIGKYSVSVTSSDAKITRTAEFTVQELNWLFADDWPQENTREMKKAIERLEETAGKVEESISAKNKAELERKMKEVKEQYNDVLKFFRDLGKANKEMISAAKKKKKLPGNLADNLSNLNNQLATQAQQLKQINEAADHQPQDLSICEYLVMLNEACAAFSTFTNVWAKSLGDVVKNIALDKAVPKVVGEVNQAAGGVEAPYDFPLKEASKIYATSQFDLKSLSEKLGKAGMAGDVLQFATDVLLKIYCDVYTGKFTHNYTISFRNNSGQNWWKYGVKMEAGLSLRSPKNGEKGNIIKLKGNLEGNATEFTFFQDVEKEDEFRKAAHDKIQVIPIRSFTPLAVPVSVTEADILGFGAIARGLATPAYFNIPIDAEYNVDEDKIKIFVNEALIDFSLYVANQFVFVMYSIDGLIRIKHMTFPIHKAHTTIRGVLDAQQFVMKKDGKGNLSFQGKGNRHIGDGTTVRETDLNFTIMCTKE
ncbi:MAG: hypothetical protein ABWZ25_00460 [Chitinophagaceae bacterium]